VALHADKVSHLSCTGLPVSLVGTSLAPSPIQPVTGGVAMSSEGMGRPRRTGAMPRTSASPGRRRRRGRHLGRRRCPCAISIGYKSGAHAVVHHLEDALVLADIGHARADLGFSGCTLMGPWLHAVVRATLAISEAVRPMSAAGCVAGAARIAAPAGGCRAPASQSSVEGQGPAKGRTEL
jgi:hypothetical protein